MTTNTRSSKAVQLANKNIALLLMLSLFFEPALPAFAYFSEQNFIDVAHTEAVDEPIEFLGYSETNSWDNKPERVDYLLLGEHLEDLMSPLSDGLLNAFYGPTLDIYTAEAHPKQGEEWKVRFRTTGTAELRIIPNDSATIADDEFIGLWCGEERREPTIGESHSIIFTDWYCDDIAMVSHYTLVEGPHALRFEFGEQIEVARNGPNSNNVVGFFNHGITVATFAGDASINARQPDPAAGDLMIMTIAIRPQTVSVTTPAGWTSLGSIDGTDGAAEGADTGSVRLYTMYKVADGTEGVTNQTVAESGTTSVWGVAIYKFRSATGTYNIATSSWAINVDSTVFGATAPNNNTAFQSGDMVFLASASNGDLNTGYSGWAVTATGINAWGTVTEILDTTSATGNDIRYAAARGYALSGTAYAAPAATITAAVAASGASTIVRIRQGDGNNRSDTFVRACGLPALGTTSVAPGYPEMEIGDLLVLLVEVRDSTVTPTNPANWTNQGNYTGGVGAFGIDAGNAKIQGWTRHASSTVGVLTGTLSVTLTSGNTAVGQICSVHRDGLPDNATAWSVDVDGGSDNSAGTAWSVTGTGIDLTANSGGDVVIVASGINSDTRLYSAHALAASGITFQDVFEVGRMVTSGGNDSGINVAHGYVDSGTALNVAPTFTMTASGTVASEPAGASIILAIHGNQSSETQRNVRLISTTIKLLEGTRFTIY